ncbi:MAG: hypothetical protein HYU36_06285 [Planctomycetes bacterium]|nr:hypothetical protein [Planctomycetota bacterium]
MVRRGQVRADRQRVGIRESFFELSGQAACLAGLLALSMALAEPPAAPAAPKAETLSLQSEVTIPPGTRAGAALLQQLREDMEAAEGKAKLTLSGGLAAETLDAQDGKSESFITLDLGTEFSIWKLGIGLGGPIRVSLEQGSIRHEDWDELADFFNVAQYVRFGHRGESIYARAGSLPSVSLGHATIVDRLGSEVDADRIRRGLEVSLDFEKAGVDYFQTSLGESPILGGRAFVRPLKFFDVDSFFERLGVGFSFVTDMDAPARLRLDSAGRPQIDEDGNLHFAGNSVEVFGFDLDLPLVASDWFSMTAYADEVFIRNAGQGFHTGFQGQLKLPLVEQALLYQAEYRLLDSDYIPTYFDSLYDVQQFHFPDSDSRVTKLQQLQSLRPDGSRASAAFFEAAWAMGKTAAFGANWQDTFKDDNDQSAQLGVFGRVAVSKYRIELNYIKKNFGTLSEAFTVDDRSLVTLSVASKVSELVEVVLLVTRRFQVNENTREVESLDTYSISLNLSKTF